MEMETTPGVESPPTTTESTESPASGDARPAVGATEMTPTPTPAVEPPPTTETESAPGEARPTGGVAVPGPHDVLLGRGGGTNHHAGNIRFRRLTESSRARYAASRHKEKARVAAAIVRGWRAQDPPGRFLRQDGATELWFDVGDEKAIRKTSQALREKMKYALTGDGGGGEAGRQSNGGDVVDKVPTIPPLLTGDSPFAPEEDTLIRLAVEISDGALNWDRLAERKFPLRTGALLRDRWANHLDPAVDHSPFSREDDKGLHRAVDELGPHWKAISDKYFRGKRSEDQLEIRYRSEAFLRLAAEGFPEDYPQEKPSASDEGGGTEKKPCAYSRRTETDRLLSAPVRLPPSSVAAAVAAEKETANKALDEDEEIVKIHAYIQNRLTKVGDKKTGDKKTGGKKTADKKGRRKKKDKKKKSKKRKEPQTNAKASERESLPPEKKFCGMHNRNRMRWQKHFDELAEHFQRNGANAPIPKENTELKSWVYSQQVYARNNKLDADKLNLLKDIGLNFDSKWQQRYKDLAEHYERNGAGANIPKTDRNLSSWATKQRASYKSNKLDETQVSMLRNIGFDFTLLEREGNAGLWENCYERIHSYISEHGTLPPAGTDDPDEKRSRMWFFDQKIKMKKGKLSEEKLERFKQIIDTAEEGNGEEVFAKMFDRLSDYSRNHGGDANILSNSDWQGGKRLYNWAKYQRNLYKKGALDKDKATRLRSIGLDLTFDTTSDRWNTFWEKNYANLVEYKTEHGHCLVPSIYKTERHGPLGRWVSNMKVAATTGKLSNYRMTKLMELGLDFRSNHQAKKFNDRWEHRLRQLAEYKMTNEGRDPPRSAETIGPWCSLQRRIYRRGELEQDRMSKLLSIGFDFSIGRDEAKVAEEKAEEKRKETNAPPKKGDGLTAVQLSDGVKMSLLESIKSGKSVQPPTAALEVYFDIEDPPEFYEPSSLVTIHPMSQLGEHDAVFSEDGKLDCSHEGSARFRELLSEFQPTYKTTHQLRRRAVAKSVTYIVRNRGGRFFALDGTDGYFHELRDEEVVDKTVFILGRGLNARAITDELRKLEANCTGVNGSQEDFGERLDSIKASIAPGQESTHWMTHFNVLNTYVLQHGRPPQTREECPPLYDWIQLQKERQNQLENMFRFC